MPRDRTTLVAGFGSGCREQRSPTASPPSRAATQLVDVHCHCLPQLDDGPGSMEEAVALCRVLVADHVHTVVATPHQLGRFESRPDASQIRQMTRALNRKLTERQIDLTVLPGAEIRLDERLDALLAEEKVLTLADRKRHILLELPRDIFIDIEPLVVDLQSLGLDVVIAHPERNIPLRRHPQALDRWLRHGAALQVTAASLTGDFGPDAERTAWGLVEEHRAAIVATDAHDCGSGRPHMTAAFKLIAAGLGRDLARLLCVDNPARIVRGERLVCVRAGSPEENS